MPKTLRSPAHLKLMSAIISHRKERNMTQQGLADLIGRPQSFIAKIETGERRLDVIEFTEICIALSTDPSNILDPIIQVLNG